MICNGTGQERFRSLTRSYFRKADGVMLLFDVTCEQTFLNIRHWMQCIGDSHERSVPLILCGTKADLRLAAENDGVCCVSHDHAFNLAKELEARYLETSAKTGANIFEAFVSLTRCQVRSPPQFTALKYSTAILDRWWSYKTRKWKHRLYVWQKTTKKSPPAAFQANLRIDALNGRCWMLLDISNWTILMNRFSMYSDLDKFSVNG